MKPTKFEDETDLTLIDNFSKDDILIVNKNNEKHEKHEDEFINYLLFNYETINNLTYLIDWFQIIALITLITFFASLCFRCFIEFSPFVNLSIIIISLAFFVLQVNFILKIKTIIDEFENERISSTSSGSTILHMEKQMGSNLNGNGNNNSNYSFSHDKTSPSLSTILTFISFNITAVNCLCFLVLLAVRLNDSESIKISFVNIPLLISTIMAFCFLIFMLPALIEKKLFKEIILFFSIGACLVAFVVLVNSKESINDQWLRVGSPIISLLFFVQVYLLMNLSSYSSISPYVLQNIGVTVILASLILFLLNIDSYIKIHYAYICFGMLIGIVFLTIFKIINLICPKETIFTVKSK